MSTNQQHQLVVSRVKYPGGLRFVECQICSYAFVAEFDTQGTIKLETKESINQGDAYASHTLFQTPEIHLELNMDGEFYSEAEVDGSDLDLC
jgi:hypothetical protein